MSFESNSSTGRVLHWVVPYVDARAMPCATPGISTDQQFNFATTVNMLVYSPCDISFSNNADHLGQVIGGSAVAINNQFSMQYRPVPVWGIDPTSPPAALVQDRHRVQAGDTLTTRRTRTPRRASV